MQHGAGLHARMHVDLVEDAAQVHADRLLADEQLAADLAVRAALRNERQHALLTCLNDLVNLFCLHKRDARATHFINISPARSTCALFPDGG